MAKKQKKTKKAKSLRLGRKISKVIVKADGSMKTFTGKPAPWSRISDKAKFYHEKDSRYGG